LRQNVARGKRPPHGRHLVPARDISILIET
jgi:hypothetical protein